MICARVRVWWAYVTNNKTGKQEDVHGRRYSKVYLRFGNTAMAKEYLTDNSWLIK